MAVRRRPDRGLSAEGAVLQVSRAGFRNREEASFSAFDLMFEENTVKLGGQNKVTFTQPADFVRIDLDIHSTP